MLKMKPWAIAITVACVLHAGPAFAQLADPTRTRSTTQVTAPPPPPVPVQRIDPAPPPPTPLSSSLGQRDQAAPLQVPPQAGAQAPQTPAIGMGSPAAKVYDRNGQVVNGMQQVGPNRVLDTRTGRYYNTVPSGDGQRIGP